METTVTLAIAKNKGSGWYFFGAYINIEAAREGVQDRLADAWVLEWREALVGEKVGAFSNYTVEPGRGFVIEVTGRRPELSAFLIFIGTYTVQGE